MKSFLPGTIVVLVLLFFSLPAALLFWFQIPTTYLFLLYLFSFINSIIFFHLIYLRPKKEFNYKEIKNEFMIIETEGTKQALRQELEMLEDLVSRDSLTGLWNKGFGINRLQEELKRVQRNKGTFSVLMLDIDHFKEINDTWGHLPADEFLIIFAQRIKEITRLSDITCRYGGDEFFIILPDTPLEGAVATGEKLLTMTREIVVTDIKDVTLSIGILAKCETRENWEEIINRADMALYKAKKNGRNQIAIEE